MDDLLEKRRVVTLDTTVSNRIEDRLIKSNPFACKETSDLPRHEQVSVNGWLLFLLLLSSWLLVGSAQERLVDLVSLASVGLIDLVHGRHDLIGLVHGSVVLVVLSGVRLLLLELHRGLVHGVSLSLLLEGLLALSIQRSLQLSLLDVDPVR